MAESNLRIKLTFDDQRVRDSFTGILDTLSRCLALLSEAPRTVQAEEVRVELVKVRDDLLRQLRSITLPLVIEDYSASRAFLRTSSGVYHWGLSTPCPSLYRLKTYTLVTLFPTDIQRSWRCMRCWPRDAYNIPWNHSTKYRSKQ